MIKSMSDDGFVLRFVHSGNSPVKLLRKQRKILLLHSCVHFTCLPFSTLILIISIYNFNNISQPSTPTHIRLIEGWMSGKAAKESKLEKEKQKQDMRDENENDENRNEFSWIFQTNISSFFRLWVHFEGSQNTETREISEDEMKWCGCERSWIKDLLRSLKLSNNIFYRQKVYFYKFPGPCLVFCKNSQCKEEKKRKFPIIT